MNAPQVIMIVLLAIGGATHLWNHGGTREFNFNGWIFKTCILCGLLWWGGFWESKV